MNTKEIRSKSIDELDKELEGLYREQFNLRMQRGTGDTVRPHHFKKVRREIATIKTIMNEKRRVNE